VTKREQWRDPDSPGPVELNTECYLCNEWRTPGVVHLAGRVLSTLVHRMVDQSMSAKRGEGLVTKKITQVARASAGEVVQISVRARWLKTLGKCLPDRVAGQFIVKGLVANTLLDRPENPMLFHAGD
jgi:hypothetical protein